MAMTSEQVEAAAKLLGEGLSYAQIGARLGLTRNTVIGKMARVGLAHLSKNQPSGARRSRPREPSLPALAKARGVEAPRTAEAPAPPAKARAASAKTARIEPPVAAVAPPAPAPARIAAPVRGRVTLMELRPDSCRYGHGDPRNADFRFCGERAASGPYCGYHAQLCYEPSRGKR